MVSFVYLMSDFLRRRLFLILWISLVTLVFYNTFSFYLNGRQFHYLRQMLGLGLLVSRGTASVLNLGGALVALPVCRKLSQPLHHVLSSLSPGLFVLWLESAKSFHITVAITLVLFSSIHSASHFVNLWNFSRGYDEATKQVNIARYKNESPLSLLWSVPGVSGLAMLAALLCMAVTSLRAVRRRWYNAFWYTHQLHAAFLVLLVVHPLRGVLKEQVWEDSDVGAELSLAVSGSNATAPIMKFVAIKSRNWMYMALPLGVFAADLAWRMLSRNRNTVSVLRARVMAGRTLSLSLLTRLAVRPGQFVLLQCAAVSALEWHPFTVVKVPTNTVPELEVWIRVKGDWTEALENLIATRQPTELSILLDGPFSSPLQGVCGGGGSGTGAGGVSVCVAAGVGVTPFVAMLRHMLQNPRSVQPARVHLIWIVRHDEEVTWLADLFIDLIAQLRNHNRPDRFNLQLYITNTLPRRVAPQPITNAHIVAVDQKGSLNHFIKQNDAYTDEEKATLLTPQLKRVLAKKDKISLQIDNNYDICKEYPILGCRVKRGRPHWDKVFGYWVHLYPGQHLHLYCCGPKKLVKLLRLKCNQASNFTKTSFSFVHEGFA